MLSGFLKAHTGNVRVRALEHGDPEIITVLTHIAWTHSQLGHDDTAAETMHDVLDVQREVLGREHRDTLEAMANTAYLYNKAKRYARAQALAESLCATRDRVLGPTHSETFSAESLLLFIYINSRQHKKAATLAKAVYRKQLPILGPDHEDVAAVKSAMEDSEEAIMLGSLGHLGIAAVQTWWSSKYRERI
uniref:TPR domain protein n=1 Tax=Mycena chlorophos TaxID=658473 RepID=A0ABQ0LPG7_MYCCL|nr:TPR domain protein [Mycena chlorophos]